MKQFTKNTPVIVRKTTKKTLTNSKISQNKGIKTASITITDNNLSTPSRKSNDKRTHNNSIGSSKSNKSGLSGKNDKTTMSSNSSNVNSKKTVKPKLLFDPTQQQ